MMTTKQEKTSVGVVGAGVIGRRVIDAITLQPDMSLAGFADVSADWRIRMLTEREIPLFAASANASEAFTQAGVEAAGSLDDLIAASDVIVDCTPKNIGAENAKAYRRAGKRFIVQGGEKHDVAGHSFVAEATYESALGRDATRVVSCNTTSIVRTLGTLKRAGLLKKARGTLMRRATDPWESHLGGIMNTVVPEPSVPSHQGPDARLVDPDLDVVTIAVKVPETIAHLHSWYVELTRPSSKQEVLEAFASSSRILLIDGRTGLSALNSVKEAMAMQGRPNSDLYEVALWSNILSVDGTELCYNYMVDNQAIVIPETIDAIRALASREENPTESMQMTNSSLGVGEGRLSL